MSPKSHTWWCTPAIPARTWLRSESNIFKTPFKEKQKLLKVRNALPLEPLGLALEETGLNQESNLLQVLGDEASNGPRKNRQLLTGFMNGPAHISAS